MTVLLQVACYMAFTVQLWSKLDHASSASSTISAFLKEPSWTAALAPLWISNVLGCACYAHVAATIWKKYRGIRFNVWPFQARNAALHALDQVVGELAIGASAILAIALKLKSGRYLAALSPMWAACAITSLTYTMRRGRRGRMVVKLIYILAALVALKEDGVMDAPWHVQLLPAWAALGAGAIVMLWGGAASARTLFKSKNWLGLALGAACWGAAAGAIAGLGIFLSAIPDLKSLAWLLIAELLIFLWLCLFSILMAVLRHTELDAAKARMRRSVLIAQEETAVDAAFVDTSIEQCIICFGDTDPGGEAMFLPLQPRGRVRNVRGKDRSGREERMPRVQRKDHADWVWTCGIKVKVKR